MLENDVADPKTRVIAYKLLQRIGSNCEIMLTNDEETSVDEATNETLTYSPDVQKAIDEVHFLFLSDYPDHPWIPITIP